MGVMGFAFGFQGIFLFKSLILIKLVEPDITVKLKFFGLVNFVINVVSII